MGELVAESKRVLGLAIRSELALQRSAHTKRFVPTGVTDLHGGSASITALVNSTNGFVIRIPIRLNILGSRLAEKSGAVQGICCRRGRAIMVDL